MERMSDIENYLQDIDNELENLREKVVQELEIVRKTQYFIDSNGYKKSLKVAFNIVQKWHKSRIMQLTNRRDELHAIQEGLIDALASLVLNE